MKKSLSLKELLIYETAKYIRRQEMIYGKAYKYIPKHK